MISVEGARVLARLAHQGQKDKIGVTYVNHVYSVAEGLKYLPVEIQVAGLLHDVIEDTDITLEELAELGVDEWSLDLIDHVTRRENEDYGQMLERICHDSNAVLVKIADNAHNSRADRLAKTDEKTRKRLEKKYRIARDVLYPCIENVEEARKILAIVNPDLLRELPH